MSRAFSFFLFLLFLVSAYSQEWNTTLATSLQSGTQILYSGSGGGVVGVFDVATVWGVSAQSGKILWDYEMAGSPNYARTSFLLSPDQTTFYAASATEIVGLDVATGKVVAHYQSTGEPFFYLAIDENNLYSQLGSGVSAFSLPDLKLVWQTDSSWDSGLTAVLSVYGPVVYVVSTTVVAAINVKDGSLLWSTFSNRWTVFPALVNSGYVFVFNGSIVEQTVDVIDQATGAYERNYTVPGFPSFASGAVVYGNDVLFCPGGGAIEGLSLPYFAVDWYTQPRRTPLDFNRYMIVSENGLIIGIQDQSIHAINFQQINPVWEIFSYLWPDSLQVDNKGALYVTFKNLNGVEGLFLGKSIYQTLEKKLVDLVEPFSAQTKLFIH